MTDDIGKHSKSGLGKRLFFIFGGIGLLCLIGLLVFGHYFREYAYRCIDVTADTYIQDDAERAAECG
ncbi:hypothetical protein ACS3QZ_17735 [Shimia sp. W99]